MKILSWNVACLPKIWNKFGNPKYKKESILRFIISGDFSVICLQEIFDNTVRNFIQNELIKHGYHVKTSFGIRGSSIFNIGFSGGLLFASKTPIVHFEYKKFSKSLGEDYFARKGFMFVQLLDNSNFIVTHLQAKPQIHFCWENSKSLEGVKESQISELVDFVELNNINISKFYLIGDLNLTPNSYLVKYLFRLFANIGILLTDLGNNSSTTIWNIKLDWIIGVPILTEKNFTVHYQINDSDHYPISLNNYV